MTDSNARVLELPFPSGLSWGVRSRFLSYVTGSGGRVEASAGATVSELGIGSWPLASVPEWDRAKGQGILSFVGEMRFLAHFGMLDVRITDPTLVSGSDRCELRTSNGPEDLLLGRFALRRVESPATFDLWLGESGELSDDAVEFFGGVYQPGTALDSFVLALTPSASPAT